MLNRTLNKPEKADSSLRNQTDIYETPTKFKEDQKEQDKKSKLDIFILLYIYIFIFNIIFVYN